MDNVMPSLASRGCVGNTSAASQNARKVTRVQSLAYASGYDCRFLAREERRSADAVPTPPPALEKGLKHLPGNSLVKPRSSRSLSISAGNCREIDRMCSQNDYIDSRSCSSATQSSLLIRHCWSVSRSRTVTVPSFIVWPSTVMQNGVPISS